MKKAKKIGCGIGVVLLVIIILVNVAVTIFLRDYLGTVLQEKVLPIAEKKLKVDMELGGASVDLLGGSIDVDGLKMGNPEGFEEDTLFALEKLGFDLGMKALLDLAMQKETGVAEITRIQFKGCQLNIIQNPEIIDEATGKKVKPINLKVLADTVSGPKKEKPEEKPKEKPKEKPGEEPKEKPEEKPAGPVELPPAVLKLLDIGTGLAWIDHANNVNLGLMSAIHITDISTEAAKIGRDGTIAIEGALAGDAAKCVTSIKGTVAPIGDPMKATFSIEGDIANIDLSAIGPYLELAQFGCEELGLKMKLVCNEGVFDGKESVIAVVAKNVILSGKPAEYIDRLPSLTIPVPVEGTLTAPSTPNFAELLLNAVMQNAKDNVGGVIKGAAIKAVGKELGVDTKGISIGGLFGKKDKDKEDGKKEESESPAKSLVPDLKKDKETKDEAPAKKVPGLGGIKKPKLPF